MKEWIEQVQQLQAAYPSAVVRRSQSGAHLVTIPDFRLRRSGRKKWDRDSVTIHFRTPPGYPGATPDASFWADPDLRTRGEEWASPRGADMARDSYDNVPLGFKREGGFGRYFRLHPQDWHVNRDSLYTLAKLIDLRLQQGP